jgi:hypothetical protein
VVDVGPEWSKGKVRPMLPRPSDVAATEPRTGPERLDGRNPDGTARRGNTLALGRGWKSRIRRAVAHVAADVGADAATVQSSAEVVYRALLSEAPVSGALMRMNAASCALEFSIAEWLHGRALAAGLLTVEGEKLEGRASQHRQRAERLSVTVHALSQRPRVSKRRKPAPWTQGGEP